MVWYNPTTWGDESASAKQKRADLNQQGDASSRFAGYREQDFAQMGAEAQAARDRLRAIAEGKDSLSAEQLRQNLARQVAQQRSFAASATPQNAAMAAMTAANNLQRSSYGTSGQAVMAGIAERNAANQTLMDAINA